MKYIQCISCANKAAYITLIGNALLVAFKVSAGVLGNSRALVADGIHSSADVVIAVVTLVALAISGKGPDKSHPYGHGKIELIAAAVVTAGLFTAVLFLFKGALFALHSGIVEKPAMITFFVAIISIVVNEFMFRINACAGKELRSPALIANAWHNRYDSFTSVVVAVGILGALFGFYSLDPIAALLVGVVIIKISLSIFQESFFGLMDKSIPEDERNDLREVINEIKGVTSIEKIEGRRIGQKLWVDLKVKLEALTVSQSYSISRQIREAILFNTENVEDVQIETIPVTNEENSQ
jgi:cation diffusion facilitator family transporter